ncbi:MAG: SirB2 family protein [Bdellovibrionota bacterium]|nr:SirB2 family protein [Bdellovibrionota bacterium]
MFSYQVYKLIHLASVFMFLSTMGASFFLNEKAKLIKVLAGISSFLILVGGMGLLARLGVSHGEPFPFWVASKIGIWLGLAILAPVLAKRLKTMRHLAFVGLWFLAAVAAYLAIYKPGF